MYLGLDPVVVAVAVRVAQEAVNLILGGALKRAAHARAKKQAWEVALQRIPEDAYIDYTAYVHDYPDLAAAWQSGSWSPGHGATQAEMGLIHIREFGPRDWGAGIKPLRPGPRPDAGPTNGFALSWPVMVLRQLPQLANPVPAIPGVNMAEANPTILRARLVEPAPINWGPLLAVAAMIAAMLAFSARPVRRY